MKPTKKNHSQPKKSKTAGLAVRTNLRGGAYFSITLGGGGGNPVIVPSPSTEPGAGAA